MRRCISFCNRSLRRGIFISLLAVLPLGSALAQDSVPPPPPDSAFSARVVRISDVKGQVQIWENGQLAFSQAEPNMPALQGMRFVTGDDGRLEIEFEDGSVARLAPNSSFRLTQLSLQSDGSTATEIDALSGLSYYELASASGRASVNLGQDAVTPIGNSIFRIDLDSSPNQLAVMQGQVHIEDGQGVSVDIHPDQTFQTYAGQSGEFTVADSVTANSWDQWNSDRDQALSEMDSDETTARAGTGNPDDASWNDLDYYGSWYNLPGYGQVWSPNDVSADWAPYADGYWGYYPSVGYVWISGYPWGWWPYHCGTWDYLDGTGWVWMPVGCGGGAYGAAWYPYAGIWHHPPGYDGPRRPRRPGPNPPHLIAVGRSPGDRLPIRTRSGLRQHPRPLTFNGSIIQPLPAELHPLHRGPLGEAFTTSIAREHPEAMRPGASYGDLGAPQFPMPAAPRPLGTGESRPPVLHRSAPPPRAAPAPRAPSAAPHDSGRPHR